MKDYFKGKSIVITGATSGLGKDLAEKLMTKSANIAAIGRNKEALKALESYSKAFDTRLLALACDISDLEQCKLAFAEIEQEFGKIDILINNAGITNIAKFQVENGLDITRNIFEINFFGAINCTSLALESIKKNQGSIVNISSVAGFSPLTGRTAYAASKYAMHGFFDTLRTELKEDNVHVMIACPTFIQTAIRTETEQKVQGETLTTDYVSNKILKGIVKRKKLLLIGKTATFAFWMYKFFPSMYEKIMIQNQKNKF